MTNLKDELLKTLYDLCNALLKLQITEQNSPDYGAIFDPACNVFHTRAGEAVFPFAVAWKHSRRPDFLQASTALGNWLISQQQYGGFWYETPDDWTGTTADQLLMLALAYPLLKDKLSKQERTNWRDAIRKAADYLAAVMGQDFAHCNYWATTAASLAAAHRIISNRYYLEKAQDLAQLVIAKINYDGFIEGEGDKIEGIQYGVDLGYNMDMSIWGLALYARLASDTAAWEAARRALETHHYFVYPDGAIDNSWGTRSYKWTIYGSKTADGCQVSFSLFANENPVYYTAALRNLSCLRNCMRDGLVGYGPWYWDIYGTPPCIYPTFARAKNIALSLELGHVHEESLPPLPADKTDWFKWFHSVSVVVVRTKGLMATVTAYNHRGNAPAEKTRYSNHPTGGSISALWADSYGWLQISSQSRYRPWEEQHMPEISESLKPLTPRIEFYDGPIWYTNLHEFSGQIWVNESDDGNPIEVTTLGELKDQFYTPGGIAYVWIHRFFDHLLEKEVILRYHGRRSPISIVEPIVWYPGLRLEQRGPTEIHIKDGSRLIKLTLESGPAEFQIGKHPERYQWPFPSARCLPIVLKVTAPSGFTRQVITYRLTLETPENSPSI